MTTVIATTGSMPDQAREISYCDTKVIGNGSFGVVYQARLIESGDLVAIKKVLQDKRFKVCCKIYYLLPSGTVCLGRPDAMFFPVVFTAIMVIEILVGLLEIVSLFSACYLGDDLICHCEVVMALCSPWQCCIVL